MNSSSSRLRAIVLLTIIFVVGGVAGAAVDRTWIRRAPDAATVRRAEPRRPAGSAEIDADRIPIPLMTLQLSQQEERELHEIARRWRPQAMKTMLDMQADISDLENNMFAEMLCVLSKEKQNRYLAQMQENGADAVVIDKRFRLVRSNQCESVRREEHR